MLTHNTHVHKCQGGTVCVWILTWCRRCINSLNPKLWLNVQSSIFFFVVYSLRTLAVCSPSQTFEQKNIPKSSVVLLFMHTPFSRLLAPLCQWRSLVASDNLLNNWIIFPPTKSMREQKEKIERGSFPKSFLFLFFLYGNHINIQLERDGLDWILDSPLLIQWKYRSRNAITLLLSPCSSLSLASARFEKTPRAIHPSLARSKIACAICLLQRGGGGSSIHRAAPLSWALKCSSRSLSGQKKKGEEKKTTSAAAATKQLPAAWGTRQFSVHIFVRAHIFTRRTYGTRERVLCPAKCEKWAGCVDEVVSLAMEGPHMFHICLAGH